MKPTLKSINDHLPRFDELRSRYYLHSFTGIVEKRVWQYFDNAFADLDDDGNVCGITIYGSGDAYEERHYYAIKHPNVVCITDQLEDAISGQRLDECGYNAKKFRNMIVREIQECIMNV